MIVCPNCTHPNPDGAVQCEACYTPLPTITTCPSCGASVQSDASFCGQCGFDLRPGTTAPPVVSNTKGEETAGDPGAGIEIPDLPPPEPLIAPDPIAIAPQSEGVAPAANAPPPLAVEPSASGVEPPAALPASAPPTGQALIPAPEPKVAPFPGATQIQTNQAKLLHVQTNNAIELPAQLALIRIGKPNDRIPPDIDVSGFPNSEIVSRNHAALRVEGDIYYIEDVGSSNGTYINNMPLPYGNRHRLRPGDRIALGKGDKVTFIFQLA